MASIVLDPAEVIVRLGSTGDGTMAVVIRHSRHHDTHVDRVDPVLVECHCVEQGVVGAEVAGGERRGVDGPEGGQGAVGAVLDLGFDVVEQGFRLPVATTGR